MIVQVLHSLGDKRINELGPLSLITKEKLDIFCDKHVYRYHVDKVGVLRIFDCDCCGPINSKWELEEK